MCGWLWLRPLPTTKPGSQHEPGPAILLLLRLLLLRLAMVVVVAWAACVPSETAAAKRTVMLFAHNRKLVGLCLRLGRPGAVILVQVLPPEL